MDTKEKTRRRVRRKGRVRAVISGTSSRPRLAVFRSNTQIAAQIIDDEKAATIAAVQSSKCEGKTPLARSEAAGTKIAELAKKHNVESVVFDRGGFRYTGNIKAFADAARKGGLHF